MYECYLGVATARKEKKGERAHLYKLPSIKEFEKLPKHFRWGRRALASADVAATNERIKPRPLNKASKPVGQLTCGTSRSDRKSKKNLS